MNDPSFAVGEYRLRRVHDRLFHYAHVVVAAQRATTNTVSAGTAPFAWRLDAYGTHAYALDTDTALVEEAVDGAEQALAALPAGSDAFFAVVTSIQTSNVDTFPGDVRYAAGHALWRAVGHQRADAREVSEGRLVFPDETTDAARI
ncbi:hypothetical protein [Promicromonospora sp. NPDC057488]|uniref:hypothetical protein n=1 Tax=Promicromonospora sp. NPDC057488 TaxID=3346147 RepID=UPI0036727857